MPNTQQGQGYKFGVGQYMQPQDILSNSSELFFSRNAVMPTETVGVDVEETERPKPNLLWTLFGILIVLVVLKIASEHEKSGIEPHIAGIGVYNFIVIGLMAMLFLVTGKAILNKYYLKGVTELMNAA